MFAPICHKKIAKITIICKNSFIENSIIYAFKTDATNISKCKFNITSPVKILYKTKFKYTNYCTFHIKKFSKQHISYHISQIRLDAYFAFKKKFLA